MRYAILVCSSEGDLEYVRDGALPGGRVSVFTRKSKADAVADFMRAGLDEGEAQVNVVEWHPQPVGETLERRSQAR